MQIKCNCKYCKREFEIKTENSKEFSIIREGLLGGFRVESQCPNCGAWNEVQGNE